MSYALHIINISGLLQNFIPFLAYEAIRSNLVIPESSSRQKADKQLPAMLIIHLCLVFHENETVQSIISTGFTCLWISHLCTPCIIAEVRRGSVVK